jgi:cytochrome c
VSTLWDYINRSMPFGNAQSLEVDEVYAITAYILYSNDLIEDDYVLSNENLADFTLPNANGFFLDNRDETEYAQFSAPACMENCKEDVKITMHATVLDVTPGDPNDGAGTPAGASGEGGAAAPAAEPETKAEVPVAEAAPEPVVEIATADPALIAAGEKVFKKCKACHKVGDDAKNGVGPALNGIVGHAAGAADGFKYASDMAGAAAEGLIWDSENLHTFLEKPKAMFSKTKMSFAGLKSAEERDAVIAYLSTFTQ